MGFSEKARNLTKEVKKRAVRYGSDLVGIVSAETLDAWPRHWIGHWEYRKFTGKTTDYMYDSRSLVILGNRVWDNVFEVVVNVGDHCEWVVEWRGRLYARRLARFLQRQGFETVLEPDLLSKKRMAQLAGLGNFGKNSLIINPVFGPWFRLRSILTNAELVPDQPFTEDLCGDCEECLKACPTGALTPYEIDPDKCLLGMKWEQRLSSDFFEIFQEHCPTFSENTWLMCTTCQLACPIGRELRGLGKERRSRDIYKKYINLR